MPTLYEDQELILFSATTFSARKYTENWLLSLKKHGFENNFFLVNMDTKSYYHFKNFTDHKISKKSSKNILFFKELNFSNLQDNNKAAEFGTATFNKISCTRPIMINLLLKYLSELHQYNNTKLLYMDTDSVVMRNYNEFKKKIYQNNNYSIVFQDDNRICKPKQNIDIEKYKYKTTLCSCFIYLPSTENLKTLYDFNNKWEQECISKGKDDQTALNILLVKQKRVNISFTVLDCNDFPSGRVSDHKYNTTKKISKVESQYPYWLHANYRVKEKDKISFLKRYNEWKINS